MATAFKIEYTGNGIPREEVELTDTNDVSYNIHSSIDTIMTSSMTKTYTTVGYKASYETTTSFVSLNDGTVGLTANPSEIAFMYVRIISGVTSTTPDVRFSFNGGTQREIKLEGVGDFCIVPLQGSILISDVQIKSPTSDERANVEILVGG